MQESEGNLTMISENLIRIRKLDKDLIPEAIEDMERYLSIATACTPRYENDGSQHSQNGNSKEKAMIEYAEASRKVDMLQDELAQLKLEVLSYVNKITNDKQRRFAKLYYIDQKSQREISRNTCYAYGTVRNVISELKIGDTQ